MKTRQLVFDAMLSAMCAVLGMFAIDIGSTFKVSLEGIPVILGALLFGPIDGFLIGFVGPLISQIVRYGFMMTDFMWVAPYALSGLFVGLYAKKLGFSLTKKQYFLIILITEIMVSTLNTIFVYFDAHLFGYYNPVTYFGAIPPRYVMCALKVVVYSALMPPLVKTLRQAFRNQFAAAATEK